MLDEKQLAYLAGVPPSNPQIEELVRLGHSGEVFDYPEGRMMWREHAGMELEDKYKFHGEWLDSPAVHNLLEGLPLKPAFRVYLEESVLWLQAWTQPQGIGGGFQPGTRILVLPPNAETEIMLHEIGHVGYQTWLYQRDDLQEEFMAALKRAAHDVLWALRHPGLWWLVWGYVHGWRKFTGFFRPWNPDEAFASLFSACMGNLALLPPFMGDFYRGLVGG